MATVLVALNAVFQVLLYAVLGYFYLQVLPGWFGLQTTSLHVSVAEIAGTVAVFLGIPLAAGYLTRTLGERARGRDWYEHRFLVRSSRHRARAIGAELRTRLDEEIRASVLRSYRV
jgi:ACR3 family arsenite transporter